jgi:hypothetical protein
MEILLTLQCESTKKKKYSPVPSSAPYFNKVIVSGSTDILAPAQAMTSKQGITELELQRAGSQRPLSLGRS